MNLKDTYFYPRFSQIDEVKMLISIEAHGYRSVYNNVLILLNNI